MIRLGLLGEGIAKSRMPELQRRAAALAGIALSYELIDLEGSAHDAFESAFRACARDGFTGVNVTHPFKQRVVPLVRIDDVTARALGAVNTVRFEGDAKPAGFNTDYSGFMRSFRRDIGERAIGAVAVIGAGGVGRAIAFALSALGAAELRLYDIDGAKAEALGRALREAGGAAVVTVCAQVEAAARGARGLVNCTPLGMHNQPGMPLPEALIGTQEWAFDAVYTPERTAFLEAARARGLAALSGFGLFLGQGVDAFEIFTGRHLDEAAVAGLARALGAGGEPSP